MIVFSALAQSLIEAASAPAGKLVPQFADLVLLVDPAIEGSRYLPVQDLVCSPAFKNRTIKQLPVFICAQAENDQPVGTWFPVGNIAHKLDEATIGDVEKECVTHAIGFVPTFRTHTLAGPQGTNHFVLTPPGSAQVNPFWVVGATKDVIDGHGGIWQAPFLLFIAALLFQHVQASQKGPAEASALKALPGEPYEYCEWRVRRVGVDYHVEIDVAGFRAMPITPLGLASAQARGRSRPTHPAGRRNDLHQQQRWRFGRRNLLRRPVHERRHIRACAAQ